MYNIKPVIYIYIYISLLEWQKEFEFKNVMRLTPSMPLLDNEVLYSKIF
jgi:hypothetical protein